MYCLYLPSAVSDAEWKDKHLLQWRVGVIQSRISLTQYKLVELATGRSFQRGVSLLAPYKVPLTAPQRRAKEAVLSGEPVQPFVTLETTEEDIAPELHSLIAVRVDNTFWIAKVLKIVVDGIRVHYYGPTKNQTLQKVRFRPVWTNPDQTITFGSRPKKSQPWSGEIANSEILLHHISLTKHGCLTTASMKRLRGLPTSYTHAEMP